jgi:uncharacterized protein DUF6788
MVGIGPAGLPIVLLFEVSTRCRLALLVDCAWADLCHPHDEAVRVLALPALATVHLSVPTSSVLLKRFSLQCTIFVMTSSHIRESHPIETSGCAQEKKMLRTSKGSQTVNETKHDQPLHKILRAKGVVRLEWVRCGRDNCRCARGELHGPYYFRYWREGTLGRRKLRKEYIKRQDEATGRAGGHSGLQCQARTGAAHATGLTGRGRVS